MKAKTKNSILCMLYSLIIGAVTGIIIWLFLRIMNLSIHLIWDKIPTLIEVPFYTIIVCTLGGLIIGIFKKKYGDYPEELEVVIDKVKKDGKYSYKNIKTLTINAMLPLIFGGSIGPEAGLSGVIAGLCSWIGDKLKNAFKEMKELTQIGISATLGTIFASPMFGFIEPIESENQETKIPKKSKMVLYFLAIFGAFGIFIILNNIFNIKMGMPSFTELVIGKKELLFIIPLIIIGLISAIFYSYTHKQVKKISNCIQEKYITKGLIAGLLLGIVGTILPYTMFSGEHQLHEIMNTWQEVGVAILIITGLVKLVITSICVEFGFKGGHFFPCIFSGVVLGYASSILLNIDPIFSVIIVTTTLMSYLLNKPLATILLLMIMFPASALPVMLLSAVIGSSIKSYAK